MASRQRLLLRVRWARTTTAAALACHLTCVLLLAGTAHALDPNKHISQYIHTSWRMQDGSLPRRHVCDYANLGWFPLVFST